MKVVIWFGTHGGSQLLFENGQLFLGIGPRQTELITPFSTGTLADMRHDAGNDDIGKGLPENTNCEYYEIDECDGVIVAEI